jgi:steroid delta-isomerase-like uncharacterized protein
MVRSRRAAFKVGCKSSLPASDDLVRSHAFALEERNMSLSQNKDLARRAIKLWTHGSKENLEQIFAADYVNHQQLLPDSAQAIRGLNAWKQFVSAFHQAFPDFEDRIVTQIAEGDLVATQFVSSGTQNGQIMGIPATSRRASWTGMVIDRIANGKIVESWVNWDMFGMLQQLGAVQEPK